MDWTAQALPGTPSKPVAIRGGGGGTPPGGSGGGGGGLLPVVGLASSKSATSPTSSAAFEQSKVTNLITFLKQILKIILNILFE